MNKEIALVIDSLDTVYAGDEVDGFTEFIKEVHNIKILKEYQTINIIGIDLLKNFKKLSNIVTTLRKYNASQIINIYLSHFNPDEFFDYSVSSFRLLNKIFKNVDSVTYFIREEESLHNYQNFSRFVITPLINPSIVKSLHVVYSMNHFNNMNYITSILNISDIKNKDIKQHNLLDYLEMFSGGCFIIKNKR